jgi:hypothetical protein
MPFDEATQPAIRTFEDLQTAVPRDITTQNLLRLATEKLELCGRLVVFAYEAQREGNEEAAVLLERLAATSRADVDELLSVLRRHLDTAAPRTERTASKPAA